MRQLVFGGRALACLAFVILAVQLSLHISNPEIEPLEDDSVQYTSQPGNFTDQSSVSGQSPCPPGTYQPLANQTNCQLASPGHFVENNSWASIDAGSKHTCLVMDGGQVSCWGDNSHSQLGNGSSDRRSPILPGSLGVNRTAVEISTGAWFTCALLDDGSVSCWGDNSQGSLGDGTYVTRNTPTPTNSLGANRTAVAITAGHSHACALLDDGSVSCWGWNQFGQLGDGTYANRNMPTPTNSFGANRTATAISAGSTHTCALLNDGTVSCWGYGNHGRLGNVLGNSQWSPTPTNSLGRPAIAISAGTAHTCAILNDNSLSCWGGNAAGQLGDGTTSNRNSPTPVIGLSPNRTVIEVAAGYHHTCAILDDGSVRCWGGNAERDPNYGELGDGANSDSLSPVNLTGHGANLTAISIAAGTHHTCSVFEDGSVGCWGWNSDGQLGIGSFTSKNTSTQTSNLWLVMDAFSDHTGQTTQVQCPTGTYQPNQGQTSCIPASMGHYVPTPGSPSQTACSPGSYQPLASQTFCHPATPGYYVDSPGSHHQMPCPLGEYNTVSGSDSCNASSPGSYSVGNATLNNSFEFGTIGGTFGNWTVLDENNTHYLDIMYNGGLDNLLYCVQPWSLSESHPISGLFSLVAEGNGCDNGLTSIGMSYYSHSNSTFQFDYRVSAETGWDGVYFCWTDGPLAYVNGSVCPNYLRGSGPHGIIYSDSNPGGSPYSYSFVSLNGQNNGTITIPITAGYNNFTFTFGKDGSADHFEDKAWIDNLQVSTILGASSQTECGPGTFQNLSGQSFCHQATPGHYVAGNGSLNQTQCPVGTFQNLSGQSSCNQATPGHYVSSVGSSSQTACTPGTYNPSYGGTNSSFCIGSSPGHYVPGSASDVQYPCGIGTFQNQSNQTQCNLAYPGNYVNYTGAHSQNQCPPGSYQNSYGQSDCNVASPGHYVYGHGAQDQIPCGLGTYQPMQGQSRCLQSSPGHYVRTIASLTQDPCSPGFYQSNYAQASCNASSPGYFVSSHGQANQTSCPAGTYNPDYVSTSQTDCIITSSGHFSLNGSSSQTPCTSGTYQPSSGQGSCIDASPGNYIPAVMSTVQTPCNPGTFQPYHGQSSCLSATGGHYVMAYGSTNQTACDAGTYNPNNGSSSPHDCIFTSPGHFSLSGSTNQTACSPGTFQPMGASQICIDASPGSYVPLSTATAQIPCRTGTYQPHPGQLYCRDASPGHFVSGFGSINQTACPVGTYNQRNGSNSDSDCVDTSPGHYTNETGSSTQLPCDPGSYQPSSGTTACIPAQPGHYTTDSGSSTQQVCLPGTYNPTYGAQNSTSCLDASPGFFVPTVGQASQTPCDYGTYQPVHGMDGCALADLGHYVPATISTSQIAAETDYYVDTSGSSYQTKCPLKHITLDQGSTSVGECLLDSDSDRIPDIEDADDDDDGVLDQNDFCSPGLTGWISGLVTDNDGDGCNDEIEDDDDDNDGVSDASEYDMGTDPLNPDTDGDGFSDQSDTFPLLSSEWEDSDGDGTGDNSDILVNVKRYQDTGDIILDIVALAILSIIATIIVRRSGSDSAPLTDSEKHESEEE